MNKVRRDILHFYSFEKQFEKFEMLFNGYKITSAFKSSLKLSKLKMCPWLQIKRFWV